MSNKLKRWLKYGGVALIVLIGLGVWGSWMKKTAHFNQALLMERKNSFTKGNEVKPIVRQPQRGITSSDSDIIQSFSTQRKIAKNGSLSMRVNDLDQAIIKITAIVQVAGGEVYSSDIYVNGQRKTARSGIVTIKVPADKFEKVMEELKGIASQLLSQSTSTDDIAEAYTDLEAQLKNKQAEEAAFVKILDRSSKIDDVLAVTKEISRVRGEIERLEARKRLFDSQTTLSTITISLAEDSKITSPTNDWRPLQVLKDSVRTLIENTQTAVDKLIYWVIVKLPGLLVTLAIIFLGYKISKKAYQRIKNKI